MMMAHFRPADHSKGDANTIGGYAAVHARPAAFEGRDGFSYSVELMVEPTEHTGEWGGFLLFVRWARLGAQTPEGHLETGYLVRERTPDAARARLGALSLQHVQVQLDELIRGRGDDGMPRPWLTVKPHDEGGHE